MQGIYKISCSQDSRIYIGSSNNIGKRWAEHRRLLSKGIHHNRNLQLDWDAYGDESFIFSVIEETSDMIRQEQFWIDKHADCLYNLSSNAWHPMRNPEIVKKQQASLKALDSHKGHKLDKQKIENIIARLNEGCTPKDIAKDYNVGLTTIYDLISGKTWLEITSKIGLPSKRSKLTDEDVLDIINLLNAEENSLTIADKYNISITLLYDIAAGRTRKHITAVTGLPKKPKPSYR